MAKEKERLVDEDKLDDIKRVAKRAWNSQLKSLEQLLEQPEPDPSDDDYLRKTNELDRARDQKLRLMVSLAKASAGQIQPKPNNDVQSKNETSRLMQEVEKRLAGAQH